MDIGTILKAYWNDIAEQNAKALERYFLSDAYIRWNNTNEHFTSFFEFEGEKIAILNEYWGDDGVPPQWRQDKRIGIPINR